MSLVTIGVKICESCWKVDNDGNTTIHGFSVPYTLFIKDDEP